MHGEGGTRERPVLAPWTGAAAGALGACAAGALEAAARLFAGGGGGQAGLDLDVVAWAGRAYALAGLGLGAALTLAARALGGAGACVPVRPRAGSERAALAQGALLLSLCLWCAFALGTRAALAERSAAFPDARHALVLALHLAAAWAAAALAARLAARGRWLGPRGVALALVLLLGASQAAPALLRASVFDVDALPGLTARRHAAGPPVGGPREAPGPPTRERPDVVVVTLDTTRADHLSAYGYGRETSPRFDRLAAQGLLFERALSVSSWTLPTHASMFTGLSPREHGARFHARPLGDATDPLTHEAATAQALDPAHATLAELLAARGYRTGAFVAGPYLGADFGTAQGFEWYDDRIFVSVGRRLALFAWLEALVPHADPDLGDFAQGYRRAGDVNDAVFAWLDRCAGERVLLFVNYFDAHGPLRPPRRFRDLFPGSELAVSRADLDRVYREVMSGRGSVPDDVRRWMESQYDAELRYQDEELGRLLDRLERDGRLAEALVLVLADHGEHLGEDDLIGHGFTLDEPVTRIPFLVKPPASDGVAPARRRDLARQVDVLPTVLARLGLAAPARSPVLPGVSLLDAAEDRPGVSELHPDPNRWTRFGERWRRVVVTWTDGDRRLELERPTDAGGAPAGAPRERLQPFCARPADGAAEVSRAAELRAALADWVARTPEHVPSDWLTESERRGGDRAALSAVGYAGD